MEQMVLKPDRSQLPYLEYEIELLPEEQPWAKLSNEPEESYALLMILINEVPKKTISAFHDHLKAKGMCSMTLGELRECARKFQWMERAWAYERSIGESIKNKREEKMEKIIDQYDEMLLSLTELSTKLQTTKDPVTVMNDFSGLLASAKVSLPTQIATMYKARVGDKVKVDVEGKFDHRIAVAVAEFAKDT